MTRLGVMGGTFDPIHYGHLLAAEEARAQLSLACVIFVPCGQPPHKRPYQVTSAEHRYAMTVAATCANPHFAASRMEIERPGPSYTVDTLRQLRAERPDAALFFITGADAVGELLTWHEPQQLVELCQLVAVTRPGYGLEQLQRELGELARTVQPIQAPGVSVSSTEIRARVARGQPIRYLTPLAVGTYIEKHGLYHNGEPQSTTKGGEPGCR